MPINPSKSETEEEFIGRCMSEESESFPDNDQRYAVCKSYWDTEEMSSNAERLKKLKELIKSNIR